MASAVPGDLRVEGQEEEQARRAQEAIASEYELVKVQDEDSKTWLVRRKTDGQLFLGYPWEPSAPFAELLEQGAGQAVAALLNHANLVNIINNLPARVFRGSQDQVEYFSVWEFCDAGSLGGLMRATAGAAGVPRQAVTADGRARRFLPESLVWHVATSMLKALAWLHEGYREEPCIAWEGDEPVMETRGWRAETGPDGSVGEDWMPILHRDVRADNIFFQHPRGSETYGCCKLGNFSRAFVSGHVHNRSGGQVVCGSSEALVRLDKLRQHMAVQDIYTVDKNERPYFKGTDLYHLGEVLYQMMTRKEVPDREECPLCRGRHHEPQDASVAGGRCPLGEHFFLGDELGIGADLAPTDSALAYTPSLRLLVYDMLSQQYRGSGSMQVDGKNAIAFLGQAAEGYEEWKASDEDGKLYRDEFDDMVLRDTNRRRKEEADRESARRQSSRFAVDVLDA